MKRLACLAFSFALSGCALPVAIYNEALSRSVSEQCKTDHKAFWKFQQPDHLDHVLMMTRVVDPNVAFDDFRPTEIGNAVDDYSIDRIFTTTGMKQFDIYVSKEWLSAGEIVGPQAGVYRLKLTPRISGECPVAYALKGFNLGVQNGQPLADKNWKNTCIGFQYIGALDLKEYNYIIFARMGERASAPGVTRSVTELVSRRGVEAISVDYIIPNGGLPPKFVCSDEYSLFDLFWNSYVGKAG